MEFTHYDLGQKRGGEIIEVTLQGSAANIRLMDSSNFSSYKSGRRHKYQGGLVKRSPYRLQVPRSGHWHVTVDMVGLRGTVRLLSVLLFASYREHYQQHERHLYHQSLLLSMVKNQEYAPKKIVNLTFLFHTHQKIRMRLSAH